MSWLALLLIGIGVADLARSVRPARLVPECLGATVVLGGGLACGLSAGRDVAALLVVGAAVLLWGQLVARAFVTEGRAGRPLVALGLSLAAALGGAPYAGEVDGALGAWLDRDPLPLLTGLDPDRVLLVLGVLLVQMSTGNVLVRLVLAATGTVLPQAQGTPSDPGARLKGGRLLGPMERLFIVGLGLAGELTAAAIVIAAKGLLRFPELQSRREQERIHQLTEYFLVGSFVSWLVALGSLVVASG